MKKKNKLIGAFIIIVLISVGLIWNFIKKENVYILYNTSIADCKSNIGYQITDSLFATKKVIYIFLKKSASNRLYLKNL